MAVLFTSLLGGAAVLLVYALYDFNRNAHSREALLAIEVELDFLLYAVEDVSEQDKFGVIERWSAQRKELLLGLLDDQMRLIAGNLKELPDTLALAPSDSLLDFYTIVDGEQRHVAAKVHQFDSGLNLIVGRDITAVDDIRTKINLLTGVVLFFMFLVVLTSFFISTFVVRRINDIASTAHDIIETGDLSQRIHFKSTWDDLGNLAKTLNTFLSRIESLMGALRVVTDNIAHDMRTPLTRLRTHLEALLHQVEAGQAAQAGDVSRLLEESDKLLGIFNTVLRLSNLEKGKRHQVFMPVALHELIQDVLEFYTPLAEEKEINLISGPFDPYIRQGDRDLLFQVFANLIDNAIKFTPQGGEIRVSLRCLSRGCEVSIIDSGIGIAQEEVEKVFDRFYRSEKSRHTSGSGLGLSLVAVGVRLHDGNITLADNCPGLKCIISL